MALLIEFNNSYLVSLAGRHLHLNLVPSVRDFDVVRATRESETDLIDVCALFCDEVWRSGDVPTISSPFLWIVICDLAHGWLLSEVNSSTAPTQVRLTYYR